ncbi:MAG: ANTAR domain-containing protein [Butyrivibrio sp.]|nr:ANTAR domain-containing protein [Butyrivibrio sp.]
MQNIIIAFAKQEDAQTFKSILVRSGLDVTTVCTSGAQALSAMEDLGSGVIICGYRLTDMIFSELAESLPKFFEMLVIASPGKMDGFGLPENVMFLPSPVKRSDLIATINIMSEGVARLRKKHKENKRGRSPEQKKLIDQAKALLMERHNMTEPEAHKYLQKCSMDSGTDIVETAEMILTMM